MLKLRQGWRRNLSAAIRNSFATKPIDTLLAQAEEAGFQRALSAFDLVFLGVGVILGTGVFVVTGQAAATNAGPAVSLSFALAGFAAALAALCYAEMSSILPVSGSAYTYVYASMGEVVAFVLGWTLMLEWILAAALVSCGWSGYTAALVRSVTSYELPERWINGPVQWDIATQSWAPTGCVANVPAIFFSLALALLLMRGTKAGARVNTVAVLSKVLVIGLFLIFGFQHVNPELLTPLIPENRGTFGHFGLSGVLQGATVVYLSFIGFDAVSTAAQEAKNPQRDVPIGTLAPIAICTTIYVAVSLVLCGLVAYEHLGVSFPLALAVRTTGHPWLEPLVAAGAAIGLCACMLGVLVAQPRIFLAMSRDGLLPSALGRIHPRYHTPYAATWFTGVLVSVLAGFAPMHLLGELSSVGTLCTFLMVSVSVMVLRRREPNRVRRFRVPGPAWGLPLASVLVSFGLMVMASRQNLIRLVMWQAIGLVVYIVYSRRRSHLQRSHSAAPQAQTSRRAS